MSVDMGNLIALLILVVFIILMARSGKPERRDDGTLRLRYTKVYWFVGILIGIIWPLVVTGLLLTLGYSSNQDLLAAIAVAALPSIVGIALLVSCIRTYVIVGESGIEVRTGFGSVKQMAWNDITKVRFSGWKLQFTLEGPYGASVHFPGGLTGMKEFVEMLRIHTSPNVHEQAVKEYGAPRSVFR